MTKTELYNALSDVIDTYYNFAPMKTPVPYAVFVWAHTDNFSADNVVFQKVATVTITVYSNTPDTESAIDDLLDSLDLFWTSSGAFEASDGAYTIIYNLEVIDNA